MKIKKTRVQKDIERVRKKCEDAIRKEKGV